MYFMKMINNPKWSFILIVCFLVDCQGNQPNKMTEGKSKLDSIGDLRKYQREFNVTDIRTVNSTGSKNSLLFFYQSSCGLKVDKDSIKGVVGYVISFSDSSNSSVDVVEFANESSARLIADQLMPVVQRLRQVTAAGDGDNFCLSYYLSRIYNFASRGNKLYLFGYDRENASARTITMKNLQYLDKVCDSLKASR